QNSSAAELPPTTLIMLLPSLLLRVTRIVCWIHVFDYKRPHALDLDDCFRGRPGIVLHPRRHDHIAASAHLFSSCFIKLISRANVKCAGNYRNMLCRWVRMRRNLVTSRGLQPHCEQSLLVWITSQHRQFRPGGNPGGAFPHFKSAGLRTTCCSLVADSVDFLDASFFSAATAASENTKGRTSIKEIFIHSFLR